MSLAVFESFLAFAERAVRSKAALPAEIDPAEFESALVNYGVVLLHSHMEQCLRKAVEARCARCVDPEVRAFALSISDEKPGKIGVDSLKQTLGRFSAAYKSTFKADLDASQLADSWESIKNHRRTVAHAGQPAGLTLADLRIYYEDVRQVLGLFCGGLGLDNLEIAAISPLIARPLATACTVGGSGAQPPSTPGALPCATGESTK